MKVGIVGCLLWILVVAVVWYVAAYCNEYTINFWLAYAGKPAVFPFWAAGLIALVPAIGQFSIPAALITYIVSYFI